MGRGYSANRSKSARATTKMKRQRSMSIGKLRENIERSTSRAVQQRKSLPTTVEVRSLSAKKGGKKQEEVEEKPVKIVEIEDDSDYEPSEPDDHTVMRQAVLSKYKMAGKLADELMQFAVEQCTSGSKTFDIMCAVDAEMYKRLKTVFSNTKGEDGKKIPKGVSYPTNISVNNVLCNHTPFTEMESMVLKDNDVVKINFGIHIDGYPVTVSKTMVVQGPEGGLSMSAIDTIDAARVALAGMIRMLRPGTENGDITDFIHHVGHHFETEAVEGVLSTRTKRWMSDSMQAIITRRVTKEDPQQDVAVAFMQPNQVWTLDVAFTNAPTYKMSDSQMPINVFRKNEILFHQDHRLKAAETVSNEIRKKFFHFPFSPRHCEQPLRARLGIAQLNKQSLLDAFNAVQSKKGSITSRFTCTVAITNKRIHVICGDPGLDFDGLMKPLPQDIKQVLSESLALTGEGTAKEKQTSKKRRTETGAKVAE